MLGHVYGDIGMSSSNRFESLSDDTMLTNSQIPHSTEVEVPIASTQPTSPAPDTPSSKRAKRRLPTSPASQERVSSELERFITRVVTEATAPLRDEIESLKTEIAALKSRTAPSPPFAPTTTATTSQPTVVKETTFTDLKQECNTERLESYGRRNTLRFFGVSEIQGEDTTAMCIDACHAMGMNIGRWEIDTSHRVGPRYENKPRAIICKFIRRETKYEVLRHRKGLSQTKNWYNVRVHEDMSRTRNRFFHKVKSAPNCIVTTMDGKIEIKRGSEKIIIIDNLYEARSKLAWSESDLSSVFPRAPRE
jgi:hypothetical protein